MTNELILLISIFTTISLKYTTKWRKKTGVICFVKRADQIKENYKCKKAW